MAIDELMLPKEVIHVMNPFVGSRTDAFCALLLNLGLCGGMSAINMALFKLFAKTRWHGTN